MAGPNAIEISLQLQDQMTAGLSRASGEIQSFTARAMALGAGIGVAAGALVTLTKSISDQVEQLDNLSASTGISAANLQVMQSAFRQGGVDAAALSQGLNFLNRAIASNDPALVKLGVTSHDTFQAFMQAAQGIAATTDSTKRAQLTFEIFGRGGAQLIPILNNLATNFDGLAKAADASGARMNDSQLKAMRDVDAASDKLGESIRGLSNQFVTAFAPAIAKSVDWLTKLLAKIKEVQDAGNRRVITEMGPKAAEFYGLARGGGGATWGPPTVDPKDTPAGRAAAAAAAERQKFLENTFGGLPQFGTFSEPGGLRGGRPGGSLVPSKMVEETKLQLDQAGKAYLEFARTVETAFTTIGRGTFNTFFTVLSSLTSRTQTFASAMKTLWQGVSQSIMDAMAQVLASAITKGFLKLLGIVIGLIPGFGPAAGAAVEVASGGIAAVSPGTLGGASAARSSGGNNFFIQTFDAKSTLGQLISPTGSLRGANSRMNELAAVG